MLATKVVNDLRNGWNEKAAKMFMEASSEEDPQLKERLRGGAEMLTICATALKAAQEN